MPKPKRKTHKAVTAMVSDTRRKPQQQKPKNKLPAGINCTRIAVEFAGRLNEKNFEDWVRRESARRGREIIVYNLAHLRMEKTIKFTIDSTTVSLLKQVCDETPYYGVKLVPRIESVDAGGAGEAKEQHLKTVITALVCQRLKNTTLDLTAIASADPILRWTDAAVITALCDVVRWGCTACTEIILRGNGIRDLSSVGRLLRLCPTIENLSLEANDIADMTQFKALSGICLRNLLVGNNPITLQLPQDTYMEELRNYIPTLESIDCVNVSSKMVFLRPLSVPRALPSSAAVDGLKNAAQHLMNVLGLLMDHSSSSVAQVMQVYSPDACFSYVFHNGVLTAANMPTERLRAHNRNLLTHGTPTRDDIMKPIFYGESIGVAIKQLPPMRVDPLLLVCDAQDLTGISERGACGLFTYHGTAFIGKTPVTYHRRFVVFFQPKVLIANDQLSVRPFTGQNPGVSMADVLAKSREREMQQEAIATVMARTRLNAQYAEDLLKSTAWNIDNAMVTFKQFMDQGRLDKSYFQ